MYPPDLYSPAWSGPVYPPSILYPLAGSRSVTGYIKPQKDGTIVYDKQLLEREMTERSWEWRVEWRVE